jgi:cysteinyl-tRNA synthetase
MVLNSGYRGPLTYTDEVVDQTERALERLKSALRPSLPGAKGISAEGQQALAGQVAATKTGFIEAMDDDMNTAGSLSHLFELVRAINQARADGAADAELKPGQEALRELCGARTTSLPPPRRSSSC